MKEIKQFIKEARERIGELALAARQTGVPVLILLEGWGGAGKGEIAGKIISEIDPRFFNVYAVDAPSSEDRRYPFIRRYWKMVPERGNIAVLVRSWYREIGIAAVEEDLSKSEIERRTAEILDFERMLCDDGYLILKFFLRISKAEQEKRFRKLERDSATSWRVTEEDWNRHRRYSEYRDAFDAMIDVTDTADAPWHVIDAHDKDKAALDICDTVAEQLSKAIDKAKKPKTMTADILCSPDIVTLPAKKLNEADLSPTCPDDVYKKRLDELQDELFELQNRLYRSKTSVVIVYEGWDAAGKGGSIKRLTRGLDPRGYEVIPVGPPTKPEHDRHFLWRFWMSLPKNGHIAIYDRSWYGRVLVERIEGLCSEEQWKQAYDEINRFERSLSLYGMIIIKFWLHIDKETQLERFLERQNTPGKQWKITEADWRNREKWDEYEVCINEMLVRTNTEYAPWTVIASNDKKYARIMALQTVIDTIKKHI